jgi:hypothetical protein
MKRLFSWRASWDRIRQGLPIGFCNCVLVCSLFSTAAAIRVFAKPRTTYAGVTPGQAADRMKLADGDYAIYEEGNSGAVGPAGEEVYDFHESWTLWRTGRESYEVEGERRFDSPRDVKHADRFQIQLSRDLTPIRTTEFAKLVWRRNSGPTTCEFLRKEVHCFSDSGTPGESPEIRIPMELPYGFLWPISPFSLSGLTRQAERDLNRPNPIQLLSLEQPSPINPLYPIVRNGQLQYLGDEEINAAGQVWHAHKFSLKVPSYPQFLIWTSTNGLLLSVAVEHAHANWPREGMKLSRFHKWADF